MIQIQNLSFGYSKRSKLYDQLNLTLEKGKIYGLLGKNGVGKTTLLKNIVGLLHPTNGSILVNDFTPSQRQPSFLQTVAFIPEQVYFPALTVAKYLDLHAGFYPNFDRARFDDFMATFQLDSHQKLTQLSMGEQKKCAIAFALACNAAVVVMDEPTNGLDIPAKSQFRKIMASAATDDCTFIISTHQTRDLDNLIDQVVILEAGDLLLNASMATIGQKLHFTWLPELPNTEGVIFAEPSMLGYALVMKNDDGNDSKISLEYLFNAAVAQPQRIKTLFSNGY